MVFCVAVVTSVMPMIDGAPGAGFYALPLPGAKFPQLQLLTIAGLLSGTEQTRYTHLDAGGLTFKKAKCEEQGGHDPGLAGHDHRNAQSISPGSGLCGINRGSRFVARGSVIRAANRHRVRHDDARKSRQP